MYYRNKNGEKIDGKVIKENYEIDKSYHNYIRIGLGVVSFVITILLRNNLPKLLENGIVNYLVFVLLCACILLFIFQIVLMV